MALCDADSRGLPGRVSAANGFVALFERVQTPRDFATEVLGHDDSDDQATSIVDRKVSVQFLLDVHPIIHKQRQYGLFAGCWSESSLGYKHSLQPARTDFTEQMLHVRFIESFALVIRQG